MSLKKYAALPSSRMQIFYNLSQYKDLAIVDFSTSGHALYNYGHLGWTGKDMNNNIFSVHLTEVDISLGDFSKLYNAVDNIVNDYHYKNIFITPSSLACVIGIDIHQHIYTLSQKYNINIATIDTALYDDFYAGLQQSIEYLSRYSEDKRLPYKSNDKVCSILGGYTIQDKHNNKYVANLLKKYFDIDTIFDSMSCQKLYDWTNVPQSNIIIVTSIFALDIAKHYCQQYNIPYIYFSSLSMTAENKFVTQVSDVLNIPFDSDMQKQALAEYTNIANQMKNILSISPLNIICYTYVDQLKQLQTYFEELDIQVTLICSHKNCYFEYMDINDFIQKQYNGLILSYDKVCEYYNNSIAITNLALDYKLNVPLQDATIGVEGMYRLSKALSDKLL